ncbi:MAG: hypothetical protein O2955_07745 [Planctomycetota bacterium]|nr:hypothetical protein [Planctomycetota bacterium]MDA1212393.1 hypothetical protein [Planctomycetota bacterium]
MNFPRRPIYRRLLLVSWLIFPLGFNADAFSAPPTLTYIYPAGGQRGTTVSAKLNGDFTWPIDIWAPGVDIVAGEEKGKLDITIPADLPTDRIWLRVHNAEGASSPAPFLVGSLSEIAETEPNNAPETAQALAQPEILVNGALQSGGDVDAFSLELAAGQTVVASVDANGRIGSPVDTVVQVVSPTGTVLAENHDDVDFDSRLAYTAKTSGPHIVRIFGFSSTANTTIAFQGEASYIYRLTITTGPFITHTLPSSVPLDVPGDVEVFGWNIPAGTRLPVVPLGGERLAEFQELDTLDDLRGNGDNRFGLAFVPNMPGSNRVRLSSYPPLTTLANGTAENPLVLAVPQTVTGFIQNRMQRDVYRLPLKMGQPVVIVAESHNIDSVLDPPLLKLTDPAGNVAAEIGSGKPPRASIIAHAPAQDGDYLLTVRSRFRQGGDRCFYRLTVRPEISDFELTATADAIVVAHDKPTEFEVKIVRRAGPEGVVGPITIEAVGLPEGVTAAPVVSEPTGDTAGTVKLSFTTTGTAFSGPIRLTGTATQPHEIKRFICTPPKLMTCFETFWLTSVAKPE